jgi:GNAT superfamily N-acetyltransferase
MRWNEIFESQGPSSIEFDFDGGSVEGYTVDSSAEQLPNWLARYDIYDDQIVENIRSQYQTIAMLNNINVEEDSRGTGMGNDLLESFESEASSHGAQIVLLIADVHESQSEGFDLTSWYERSGYQIMKETNSGPLMIKKL